MKISEKIEAISRYAPNIQKAISKYHGSGVSKDILEAKAENIVVKALNSYKADSNTNFETHLYNHLRGLYREVNNMQNIVRIPEHKKLQKNEDYFNIKDSFQDGTEEGLLANGSSGKSKESIRNILIKARPDLTDREKEVFDRIYGFNNKKETEHKKIMSELGMSKSRYSEIKNSISKKVIPFYAKKTREGGV